MVAFWQFFMGTITVVIIERGDLVITSSQDKKKINTV